MYTKKVIFTLLLTLIFMISCQKDDQELQEIEQLETSSITKDCVYQSVKISFRTGSLLGCQIVEKMNAVKSKYALLLDKKSGCPIYQIPETKYPNCEDMNNKTYIENWKKLNQFAGKPDSETLDIELDDD